MLSMLDNVLEPSHNTEHLYNDRYHLVSSDQQRGVLTSLPQPLLLPERLIPDGPDVEDFLFEKL